MQKRGTLSFAGGWWEGGGVCVCGEKHVFWTITGHCSPKIKTEQKASISQDQARAASSQECEC